MAYRCGYYLNGNTIERKDVDIDWDLGFDVDAKRAYQLRIARVLGKDLLPVLDVTTASIYPIGKSLSPHIMTTKYGTKLDDVYHQVQDKNDFLYMYFLSINSIQREHLLKTKTLIDVFHNPMEKGDNTQAFWLSLYKVIVTEDTSILKNRETFLNWLQKYNKDKGDMS